MHEATNALIADFERSLDAFDGAVKSDGTFGGPSLYFHYRCISEFRDRPVAEKLESDRFYELVYATLTSWGMHRMGRTATKLRSFEDIKTSCLDQSELFNRCENSTIWDIAEGRPVLKALSELVGNLRVSASDAHLVANTKTVHHFLPDLVPPIDRQYTLRWLGLNTTLPSYHDASEIFAVVFPQMARAARANREEIRRRMDTSKANWHTCPTKVLDNAIIGLSMLDR